MNETLEEMDLDAYVGLLSSLTQGQCECGLWHAQTLLAGTEGFDLATLGQTDCRSLVLADHLKATVATLTLTNAGDEHIEHLATVHRLLQDNYHLTYEVDSLTDELTSRYEDLNLVFDNNEVTSGLVDYEIALEALAKNALQRLNRGAVILLIPSKQTEIFLSQDAGEIQDINGLREANRSVWWSFVRHTNAHWIQNEDAQSDDVPIVSTYGCKLMLSPIKSIHGDVLGSLCLVKPSSGSNFSNSDRNLAEVIGYSAQAIFNATFDALTGLIQRSAFEKHLRLRREQHHLCEGRDFLLFANVDRTQVINDTYGHATGDLLLKNVANKLQSSLRRSDIVSRLDSDEFAILLTDTTVDNATKLANKLCEAIQTLRLKDNDSNDNDAADTIRTSLSIGLLALEYKESITDNIAHAELASQKAKELGGGQVQAFQANDSILTTRREQTLLVNTIQDAIANNRFELFCQPIVNLTDATQPPHFEVLLRMRDAQDNLVSPGLFLPSAERYSLMPQVDRWVFGNTLQTLEQSSFLVVQPHTQCSINLSGQTLSDESFSDFVTAQMAQVKVKPQNICFEITETTAINDFNLAQTFIDEMKGRGFRFSLDDFGTGLSSFTYLQRMPVDYVKIDGSFVSRIIDDPVSRAMVKAIADVATAMELESVGEFVEDAEIERALIELGIDHGQGYYFSAPVNMRQYLQQQLETLEAGVPISSANAGE